MGVDLINSSIPFTFMNPPIIEHSTALPIARMEPMLGQIRRRTIYIVSSHARR